MPFKYQISVFKDLIQQYPLWDDLRSYLESECLKVDQKEDFTIIKYEKGLTSPHMKWFRSVIWNHKTNRPVCVAPPKAADFVIDNPVICQEFLEGFMINCFKTDTLHITSRSRLDAGGNFYSKRSFRDLFLEAYNLQEYKFQDPAENEFYSFLVQHVEHRIVKKIDNNCVFLIHKGIVLEDGTVEIEDSPVFHNKIPECTRDFKSDWQFQGIVLKDGLGNRSRIRSDKYELVRALRGNTPDMCDRFCQLYSQNLLHKYLEYYPDEMIQKYLVYLRATVELLYNSYVDVHIKKMKTNGIFLPHIYNIHGIYLNIRPQRITMDDVSLYIYKQPWQRVAYLMKNCLQLIDFQ